MAGPLALPRDVRMETGSRQEDSMPNIPEEEPEGLEPEALRTLEAAARHGGIKPPDLTLTATAETAPLADSLAREAETATRVLQAGVDHDPKAATDAVRRSHDPRIPD
jgi:hypothetical protein